MKDLALSEIRRIAERFDNNHNRIPWRVWYVSASNGDCIFGEECVTISVDVTGPGSYPSRLVQFTKSGQMRRLRDCCILQADNFKLKI